MLARYLLYKGVGPRSFRVTFGPADENIGFLQRCIFPGECHGTSR